MNKCCVFKGKIFEILSEDISKVYINYNEFENLIKIPNVVRDGFVNFVFLYTKNDGNEEIYIFKSDLDYVDTKQECEKYIENIIFK